MSIALPEISIDYEWVPKLGGRRKGKPDSVHTGWREAGFRAYADHMETTEFQQGLDALVSRAASAEVAFMCSERLWWQCHRRLIADALVARGYSVIHILAEGKSTPHVLTPFARVRGGGLLYVADPDPVTDRLRLD